MNEENPYDENDLLERSILAMREAPTPDGPSGRTIADTLAALRGAAGGGVIRGDDAPSVNFFQKVVTMTYLHRKVAALIVAVGGLSAWIVLFAFGVFSSVSFAQVAEKLRDVKSLTCVSRLTIPGQTEPTLMKTEMLGGRMRNELPGKLVVIQDIVTSQVLMLNAQLKTADLTKVEVKGPAAKSLMNVDLIGQMRSFAGKKGEPAGELQIGKVKAKAFRVEDAGKAMTVWVDPATNLPLRIETTAEMAGKKVIVTMDELVFDAVLDEKRFSFDIPAGYTLTRRDVSINMNIEENVATTLRADADVSDGKFPNQLGDPAMMIKRIKASDKGELSPASMKIEMAAGVIQGSLFKYERRKNYDYLPGHSLGEKDAIVFWRKDLESGKIMAIFGDLTIREIKQDEVPAASVDAPPTPPTPVSVQDNVPAPVKVAPAKVVVPPPVREVPPPVLVVPAPTVK